MSMIFHNDDNESYSQWEARQDKENTRQRLLEIETRLGKLEARFEVLLIILAQRAIKIEPKEEQK